MTASELVAPANGVASAFHIRTPAMVAEVIPKTSRYLVISDSVVVIA
jgi:hypothetical protein